MSVKKDVKIGPTNQNIPYEKTDGTTGVTIAALEDMGRGDCLNQETANAMRMKIIRNLPSTIKIEQYSFAATNKGHPKLVETNPQTTQVNFCVLQQKNCVPVFMLPATEKLTANMTNEKRRAHMELVFQKCYDTYAKDCASQRIKKAFINAPVSTVFLTPPPDSTKTTSERPGPSA
jgi:hypothetical protein